MTGLTAWQGVPRFGVMQTVPALAVLSAIGGHVPSTSFPSLALLLRIL